MPISTEEKVLISFFTSALSETNYSSYCQKLVKFLSGFNFQETIFPIPANAPAEIPRIILQDASRNLMLQVGPERVDITFSGSDFNNHIDLFQKIPETLDVVIFRIGIVTQTAYLDLIETGVDIIGSKFIKNNHEQLSGIKDMQLNLLKVVDINSINSNFWTRLYVLTNTEDRQNNKGYAVEFDVNTLTDKGNGFSSDEAGSYLNSARAFMLEQLKNYAYASDNK